MGEVGSGCARLIDCTGAGKTMEGLVADVATAAAAAGTKTLLRSFLRSCVRTCFLR